MTGNLVVKSPADGVVSIDGCAGCRITRGQSQQWELSAGPHEVTFSRLGEVQWRRTVPVSENGEETVTVQLRDALPACMEASFEVPAEEEDAYGNPIREGSDDQTGYPFEIRHQALGLHLVFIAPGEFMMGSPEDENDRGYDEKLHAVRLTSPFYLGKYQVTQAEWHAATGNEPWHGKEYAVPNRAHPAVYVSWIQCREFVNELNGAMERPEAPQFALPTEAQWEFACRAGTPTRLCYGDDPDNTELKDYAWLCENADAAGEAHAHLVGRKKPNAWGLYDMHGNVWEWCQDWYASYQPDAATDPAGPPTGRMRVLRGGSWNDEAFCCRSAFRRQRYPAEGWYSHGLRVSLQIP